MESKSKGETEDGFVTVNLRNEKEKRPNSHDYRHYIRMWAQERETKLQNIKDLPKLNQEQFIELCRTLYNMFSEDANEQELYHATAAVTSLLLEIGEVGKQFICQSSQEPGSSHEIKRKMYQKKENESLHCGQGDSFCPILSEVDGGKKACSEMHDIKLDDSSPKDNGVASVMLISDDETKDDTSMSSYSVLSAESSEDDKLQCEDITEDTVLVCNNHETPLPMSGSIDKAWAITFEQCLASVLTETALVRHFEKPSVMMAVITNAKNIRMMGKPIISASDYEISTISG